MSEYIHLIGAEEVLRASHNMESAAQQINNVHNWNTEELQRQRQFMDDWLNRFESILASHAQKLNKQ